MVVMLDVSESIFEKNRGNTRLEGFSLTLCCRVRYLLEVVGGNKALAALSDDPP